MRKAKKNKARKKKVSMDIMDMIGIIILSICLGLFAYTCIGFPILINMVKKYGVKTEAIITSTIVVGGRLTTPNYIYEFYVGDKTYEGNSLVDERDSSKIGTKIQILYLDWLPWFNRPVYYWDN